MSGLDELQRAYYTATAQAYDAAHEQQDEEHLFALAVLAGLLRFVGASSVLEIGAGTGRGLIYLHEHAAGVRAQGIEPVAALREIAYAKGIVRDELIEGDARRLPFADGAFDVVSCFGVLHHVREHRQVVAEMLRVSRKAIFISDSNNFGQGPPAVRAIKQLVNRLHLWPIADLIKTKGKGYSITEGDGLSYSYSLFSDYPLIRANCRSVHLINTHDAGVDPYRTASHVALFGVK